MTESKSKVEEVARAAGEYLSTVEGVEVANAGDGSSVYLFCDDGQDAKPVKVCIDLEQFARAAIEALREPNAAMVRAAEEADETASEANIDKGGPGRGLSFEDQFSVAIDAALNEGGE